MGMKKMAAVFVVFLTALSGFSAYAGCGSCGVPEAQAAGVESEAKTVKFVDAGNKVCPVMGVPINEKTKLTVEFNGINYNVCCKACVEEFGKDPGKYIGIVQKELAVKK